MKKSVIRAICAVCCLILALSVSSCSFIDDIRNERLDNFDDDDGDRDNGRDEMTFDPNKDNDDDDIKDTDKDGEKTDEPDGPSEGTFKETEEELPAETAAPAPDTETAPPVTEPYEPDTAVPTEPDTEPSPDTEPDPDTEVSLFGYIEADVYINEYFGFGCDLVGADHIASYDELVEMSGGSASATLDEVLSEFSYVYALYADGNSGATTLNITVEDLGSLYGYTMTEREYIETAKPQLVPALESIGMTDISVEDVDFNFAGRTQPGIKISGLLYGEPFYEALAVVKNGQYIACITVGSLEGDAAEAIEYAFHSIP